MKNQRLYRRFLIFSVALFIAGSNPADSAVVHVFGPPEAGTILNGNSLAEPLDPTPPGRFQQVYSSSVFEAFGLRQGGWISGLSFRIDAERGSSFVWTLPSAQFNLSTTLRAVDGLSSVFDENIGGDNSVVLKVRNASVSGSGGGGMTGFNVFFVFSTPFFYDPSVGNLLLDMKVFEGFGGSPPLRRIAVLDAFDVAGDGVSSVYATSGAMPTAGQPSTLGLATAFFVTPVPEPSTYLLLVVGAVLAFTLQRIPRRKGGSSCR